MCVCYKIYVCEASNYFDVGRVYVIVFHVAKFDNVSIYTGILYSHCCFRVCYYTSNQHQKRRWSMGLPLHQGQTHTWLVRSLLWVTTPLPLAGTSQPGLMAVVSEL